MRLFGKCLCLDWGFIVKIIANCYLSLQFVIVMNEQDGWLIPNYGNYFLMGKTEFENWKKILKSPCNGKDNGNNSFLKLQSVTMTDSQNVFKRDIIRSVSINFGIERLETMDRFN